MTPDVKARYTDDVRAAVAHAAGGTAAAMTDVGGFESFVHELVLDGTPRIVKATWEGRRARDEMGAEVHFVDYLAEGGAPVCRPLALRDGSMLTTVPCEDGAFHVSAWAKAPGTHLPRTEFTPEVFHPWGALAGTFHRLASEYPGPPPPLARPTWREEREAVGMGPWNDEEMQGHLRAILDEIDALPRDRATFGPCHTDLHHGNIHWDAEGTMRVFDFEDMVDFWFAADLAIVMFYAVFQPTSEVPAQVRYDAFLPPLLAGYATQYELPAEHLETLPLFLRLREQTLRAAILRSMPPEQRAERHVIFVRESLERIRRGEDALGLRL